jgi:hypothetical protein
MNKFGSNSVAAAKTVPAFFASEQKDVVARLLEKLIHRMCPPARYSAAQAADVLGFHVDDIPVLVREGFLTPLGKPQNNSIKYFSSEAVANLGTDQQRMDEAQAVLYQKNRDKGTGQ